MKKGQITIYFVMVVAVLMIIFVAATIAPMGVKMSTDAYTYGEKMMLSANESLSKIQDLDARDRIQGNIDNALTSTEANIEVNSAVYRWGWLVPIVLMAIIGFMYTRRAVEFGVV